MERLLEREDELAALGSAFEEALAGHCSLVLVGGEAGSGKSSLIRGLREHVADEAAFVVVGCEPLSVPMPLAPVRALMGAIGAPDLLESSSSKMRTGPIPPHWTSCVCSCDALAMLRSWWA